MKVLFLPGGYGKNLPVAHVKGIIYNFPQKHNLVVLSPHQWKFEEKINIKIIPLNFKWIQAESLIGKIRAILLIILIGLKTAKRDKFDVIYARDGTGSLAGFIISKFSHVPLVVELNGIMSDPGEIKVWTRGAKLLTSIISRLLMFSEKKIYTHASILFVCTSGLFKEYVQKTYGIPAKKVIPLSNATDPDLFKPIDKSEAQKILGLDNKFHCVVFVGSFAPWHGLEYLVDAAPHVIKIYPNARFLIVGDGPEKPAIVQKIIKLGIENAFIFTGRVPLESVPIYISVSDLCVSPFTGYLKNAIGRCPLKLFEYMACSRPVVSTNIPGWLDEYIIETGAGILIPPEDPQELANAIIRLLKDKTLREKMGHKGREAVVNKYNWVNIARQTAEECEKALAKRKK